MNRFLAITLLVACAITAADAKDPAAPLERHLRTLIQRHPGKVALYAKNLATGEQVALGADVEVPTASTIKLAIFLEAFHQVKDGKADLRERLTLRPEDKVPGSGVLTHFGAPEELTLENLLVLMMIESDNTATNLVIDRIGRDSVNRRITAAGLDHTFLYKKVYRPAEGAVPADQPRFGLGKTTAREMGRLMESIHRCDLGAPALCARMIEIMKGQQYRNMIPRFIEGEMDTSESGSQIADKTGSLDAVRADVGILYTARGPILLSVYTYENKDQSWTPENQAETLIARLARTIFDAWGRPQARHPR
jgi:beta-lactamase class A